MVFWAEWSYNLFVLCTDLSAKWTCSYCCTERSFREGYCLFWIDLSYLIVSILCCIDLSAF